MLDSTEAATYPKQGGTARGSSSGAGSMARWLFKQVKKLVGVGREWIRTLLAELKEASDIAYRGRGLAGDSARIRVVTLK